MDNTRIAFTGYSMYPALRPGDTLILEIAAPDECAPGDIVCVNRENGYSVHRIIRIDGDAVCREITTKGDSLTYPDPPVPIPPGGIPRVIMVARPSGELIRPRRGRLVALLSRANLTPGVARVRIAYLVRTACGRLFGLLQVNNRRQ